jgi:protein-disulfide isomerase
VDSGDAGGVTGTPTFFVNRIRHSGAFDAQSLIAALEGRQRSSSTSSSLSTPR